MAHKQLLEAMAFAARNAESFERLRQSRGCTAIEPGQRPNHRLRAIKLCRACIGTELTLPRYPHDDNARENPQQNLGNHYRDEIAYAVTRFVTQDGAVDEVADNARQEDDKRVDDALYESKRNHVAVCNV